MNPHLLIYESKVEGHHLNWLRFICEDFLSAGVRLTVAVDRSEAAAARLQAKLGPVLEQVELISAVADQKGNEPLHLERMAELLGVSGAGHVFMPCLDEVSSWMLRRAALGRRPPEQLKGRLSGILLRPRFLGHSFWPPNEALKASGFRKLLEKGWFHRIFLLDETLLPSGSDPRFVLIPEPFSGDFPWSREAARKQLQLPQDRKILLHYGIASRRKGLDLTVKALLGIPEGQRPFLLCAGPQLPDEKIAGGLRQLEASGDARLLDRYVLEEEEKLCFCACDLVLLTYIRHFGSSAVLSRAAAAGRMVIASDEELTGRRVSQYKLGWLFPSGDAGALQKLFVKVPGLGSDELVAYETAGRFYTNTFSRERFRQALTGAFSDCSLPTATL